MENWLYRAIWTGRGAFVATTGGALALYTGIALMHFGIGGSVVLVSGCFVIVCPILWVLCSRFALRYGPQGLAREQWQRNSFPFIALVLLLSFIPEFWFGTPSLLRVLLILAATAGLACLLSIVVNSRGAQRFIARAETRSGQIASGIVVLHAIVFTSLLISRHYNFGAALGEDTGYYNQIFWNTLQGDFFQGSLTQDRYNDPPVHSEFALHNSPILFLLFPFYWLFPTFYTLLVLKGVAISMSAIPLFLLVKEKVGGVAGIIVVVAYLFSRNILNQSINGFHSIDFIAVALLFTFLFFLRGRFLLFVLCLVLSLAVREEVALTVWLFGLYAVVLQRRWLWVVCPVVLSVIWWYCSAEFVLVRSQIAMEGLDEFFSIFGKGRNEILATVVREPEKLGALFLRSQVWEYFYEVIRPGTLLPLASMIGLFALPTVAMNGLIGVFWPSMISIANHYSLIATVCVFVALAEAVAWIGRYSGVFNLSRQTFCLGIVCLTIPDMVLSLKDTLSYGGGKQSSLARDFVPKPYAASLRTIVDTIEPSAPVAGPGILLPQLSYRKKVYYSQALWRYYDMKFDYLILDTDPKRIGAVGCDRERYDALVTEISKSDGYELMFRKDGFEVYKRSSRADPGAISNKYTCHRQPHN